MPENFQQLDDESDWAYEGRKRVANGSDGLWLRFGVKADESCKAQLFHFSFNPCVSFFALVLLFGLVGLCATPPGEFCSQQKETWMWTDVAGTKHTVQERKRVQGDPLPPNGCSSCKLLEAAGGGGAAYLAADFSPREKQLAADGVTMETVAGVQVQQWAVPILTMDPVNGQTWTWTKDANMYNGNIEFRLEAKDCYMPKVEFSGWMTWTTEQFTWMYIVTQDIWIVFLAVVAFKYGKLKLGKENDVPEFSDFAFFSMLFTCGVATGLFFFAVTEPQYYYLSGKTFTGADKALENSGYYERNRFTYNGVYQDPTTKDEVAVYNTPNQRVQDAMTLTFFHWGLHGWVVYCLVGLCLAFMHFRKGMPMTIKTCFYPLIGNRIYGFCGDLVDTISVVATTMGVCTSLGMGVMQLNTGIEYLNGGLHWLEIGGHKTFYNDYNKAEWSDQLSGLKDYWDSWPVDSRPDWFDTAGGVNIATASKVADIVTENDQQMLLIILVSVACIVSVMLGLKNGIKNLAVVCLVLGQFVIFYVWMMDDTWFITNLFIQSLGDYLQRVTGIGFYSSAVEQSEVNNAYGEYSSWQRWWTIFYWGWWIAWAPFVGVFIARLAKGRTVREFIFSTMIAAVFYNFIFLVILGGAGLKMQLLAEKYDVGTAGCGWDSSLQGQVTYPDGKQVWEKVEHHKVAGAAGYVAANGILDVSTIYKKHPYKENVCRKVSSGKYSTQGEVYCSTVTNIACSLKADSSMPLFDVVGQYGETSKFMVGMTLGSLVLYFVASSDSGSMVDDMICANGMLEPNLLQRLLWSGTECAAACALMSVGKYIGSTDGALRALRAISIVVGIPWTIIACLVMVSTWRALQYETGERKWGKGFQTSIVDTGFTLYECGEGVERCMNLQRGKINVSRLVNTIVNLFCPTLALWKIAGKLDNHGSRKTGTAAGCGRRFGTVFFSLMFYAGWVLILADYAPVKDEPVQWGSVKGNATASDGNFVTYVSTRYGYYNQWANEGIKEGDAIKWNTKVDKTAGERATGKATINGLPVEVGVGDAAAKSRRIATIGYFFIICLFFTFLTQLRVETRKVYNIAGNIVEDFFCAFLWPMDLAQMSDQLDKEPEAEAAPEKPAVPMPVPVPVPVVTPVAPSPAPEPIGAPPTNEVENDEI